MSVGFCGSLMFSVVTFNVIGMPKFCLGCGTGSGALYNAFLAQVPVVVVFGVVVPVAISAHRTCDIQMSIKTNAVGIMFAMQCPVSRVRCFG